MEKIKSFGRLIYYVPLLLKSYKIVLNNNVNKTGNTTGLEEKKSQGTRIIIADPKQEIVDSISSGEMLAYIQESWWLIIKRLGKNSNIKINHEAVVIPDGITETRCNYNLPSPTAYKTGYRVKNLGIYLFEDGNNRWQGISYYRKGMKIGEIELDDIPEKVRNKFWGYVEVDEQWEEELATIEDSIHFGVSKTKKRSNTYQYLKLFCAERFKALLIEWGYLYHFFTFYVIFLFLTSI